MADGSQSGYSYLTDPMSQYSDYYTLGKGAKWLGTKLLGPGVIGATARTVAPGFLPRAAALGTDVLTAGGMLNPVGAGVLAGAQVMAPTAANAGEAPLYVRNAQGQMVPNPANPLANKTAIQQAMSAPSTPTPTPPAATPSLTPAPNFAPATGPLPPMARAPGPPMNIAAPYPGPTAPPVGMNAGALPSALNFATGGQANSNALVQKFLNVFKGGGQPAPTMQPQAMDFAQPQQQQGLFPKLFNDIGQLRSAFGSGASAGGMGSIGDVTKLAGFY